MESETQLNNPAIAVDINAEPAKDYKVFIDRIRMIQDMLERMEE